MHLLKRYPRWLLAFLVCSILGIFLNRFDWIVETIGIPLEWTLGARTISAKRLIISIVLMLASILISLWISLRLEKEILDLSELDTNLRVVITKIVRATLVVASAFLCGSILGIDLTLFSIVGGTLGVALGFALQRIVSSYLAGYIILIERSLEIGQIVRVDKFYGKLTRLTNRYAVLDGLDGTEMLVPNELFITQAVTNYAYTDPATSVSITITMSQDIDLEKALEILQTIALSHPRVLKTEHRPNAWVKQMNEVGIELELSVWITDLEEGTKGLKSELYREAWKAFQTEGWKLGKPA